MRRLATVALSLLLSAAALYSSAAPAAACDCALVTETEEVRGVMEFYGLVVEGVIAPGQGDVATERIRFQPEVLYLGDVSGKIELNQTREQTLYYADSNALSILGGDCSYLLIGEPGDRYVLFLRAVENGTYAPAGCASFALGEIEALPHQSLQQRYDAIKLISGGGIVVGEAPPEDAPTEHTEDTPWAVVLPLAFAIPLAVLLVPALLRRRGGSH